MKLGVISDTHLTTNLQKLDWLLANPLKGVDKVLHLGDYKSPEVIAKLSQSKTFKGVWGNVDEQSIKTMVNEKQLLQIQGYKIGMYHGHGKGKSTMLRAYEAFSDEGVDIILFGHSHQPLVETKNKVLMINPGSPTNKRKGRWFSYALLNIMEGEIGVTINFFDY